jgi:hypothetical protein
MFLAVCLCLWDFAGNPWITCKSYIFSHFYSVQHVSVHAFEKMTDRCLYFCSRGQAYVLPTQEPLISQPPPTHTHTHARVGKLSSEYVQSSIKHCPKHRDQSKR